MGSLKSTQYIFTWVAIAAAELFCRSNPSHLFLIICAICASYMVGRGLIQMNTGGAVTAWKSSEFHFLAFGYVLAFFTYRTDSSVGIGIAGLQIIFNLSRGIAEWYRASNPLILR